MSEGFTPSQTPLLVIGARTNRHCLRRPMSYF